MTGNEQRNPPKTVASNLKEGDYLSEIQYYKVVKVYPKAVSVENRRGMVFNIDKSIVEEGLFSHNQYHTKQEVTRTELVQILSGAGDTVFSANFHKKPNVKALLEKFNDPNQKIKTQKEMSEMLMGEERTIIGHLVNDDAVAGRFLVVDLEDDNAYPKQVDQRTLNWVILRNVLYVVR